MRIFSARRRCSRAAGGIRIFLFWQRFHRHARALQHVQLQRRLPLLRLCCADAADSRLLTAFFFVCSCLTFFGFV